MAARGSQGASKQRRRAAGRQRGAAGEPPVDEALRKRAREIARRLARAIPETRPELWHRSPWELLVATILSAQSTDRTINRVVPGLFERYPSPEALAEAPIEQLEQVVRPTGYYRQKARRIREVSRLLVERHGGQVPRSIEELTALPGVARKTANVVLGAAFGIASGIVVDTHVGRVSRRLGLTEHKDPVKVERDLCAIFPKRQWIGVSHRLVLHGRYVCTARKPTCHRCPIAELCPSAEDAPQGRWTERAAWERDLVRAGRARSGADDGLSPARDGTD